MSPWLLVVCALTVAVAAADDAERNLVINPGFESPAASDNVKGWLFTDHGQPFARGEIGAVDYHSGLRAAGIRIAEKPRVYVCWSQHVRVPDDSKLPTRCSLWYRAPDHAATVVLTYTAIENQRAVPKGSQQLVLASRRDWTELAADLDVPAGTRDILLELRADTVGSYGFDDVALLWPEPAAAGARPDRLLFVGLRREELPELWREALITAGWRQLAFETWDNLTPQLLRRCRAVILVGLPERLEVTPADEALTELLLAYAQAGGGVMLTQQSDQILSFMTLPLYLAEKLGTRILWERLETPKDRSWVISDWGTDRFTFTDQVAGPWSDGVRGVLYPSAVDLESYCGVLPFEPRDGWTVTLAGGPGTRTEPVLRGLDEIDRTARARGFADNVPLAGARTLGAGRVSYVGLRASIIFARPVNGETDRKVLATYLRHGTAGRPSDLQRWYLNAFAWLGAGADAVADAKLSLRSVSSPPQTTAWKLHRGVIGPRTTWSTGVSTPDQYVAAARAAGLDFIVFLDEFAALKPGGFESLKADCRRLTTGDFLALPGVTYQNDDGNHEYVFGRYLRLPSKLLLSPDGQRLATRTKGPMVDLVWLYTLLGFNHSSGWYRFGSNPYPSYDARDNNSMAVVTQAGGKVVENVLDQYGFEARSGQFLLPLALDLMTQADELAAVRDGRSFVNVIGADGVRQLDAMLNTRDGRCGRHLYPGEPSFGCTSITRGPLIELHLPRGDTDAQGDPWCAAMAEWELKLKVTAAAGLREVTLWDGDTQLRRFLPGGAKEFTFTGAIGRERQKAIRVQALDSAGREAYGRDITCDNWLLRESQCADRNNQLLDSRQVRPDGTPFFVGYGGDTTMPDKGPWLGRVRPVGCFVFDAKLGVGSMAYDGSPEHHPQVFFNPYLVVDGQVPPSRGWARALVAGQEGAPHVRPTRVVASGEALVGERVLDGVFAAEAEPIIHVWNTLFPVRPSRWLRTTARCSLYPIKPDGVSAYLWEQEFELLQEVKARTDQPFVAVIGTVLAFSATQRRVVSGGRAVDQGAVKAQPLVTWPFRPGDQLGLLRSPFGSLVVYSLSDNLSLRGDGVNYEVGVQPTAAVMPAGTRLRARLLLVGMHRQVTDPVALADEVRAAYGLSGPPRYRVAPTRGELVDQQYQLRLRAVDHAFTGTVTGLAALPGNLGAAVAGLEDRWSAVYQVAGAAGVQTRLIPVERGIGYVCLRAAEDGRAWAIGHPFTADDPQVVLSLTRTADLKGWRLEAHNPTDRAVRARIQSTPGFTGFTGDQTVALAPGTSATVWQGR